MIQGALVHLLGSRSGYTTLGQSSALPAVVRSALEHLDFGSLSREQDIASLESVPMALGQCVAGSWVVVSRVLPGGRDDVGRLTIEKVSIVVPLQVWRSNLQDVRTLVNDRALWNRARMSALSGGTINLETAPLRQLALQPALAVVLDRWFKAVEASGCVVLRAQDEAIFKVLQSISPEDAASLAWGVGLHGVPAFASICSILPTVSASSTRQVFEIQPTERDLRSRQAGALASCVKSAGVLQPFAALRPPDPIVVIPPRGPEPMFPMEDLRPIRGVHPAQPEVWRQEPSTDGRLGTRAWGIATLSLGALCLAVALFWTPSRPPQLDTGGAGDQPLKPVVEAEKPTTTEPAETAPENPAPTPVPAPPPPPAPPPTPVPEPPGPPATPQPIPDPSDPKQPEHDDGSPKDPRRSQESPSGTGEGEGPQKNIDDPKLNRGPLVPCECEKPSALEKPDVDKDKDRLSDAREKEYGSDETKPDEDQDNLSDWFEWACGTDPKGPDSDGDGVCDCKEFTQSTSPIWRDTDRDGLSDAEELDKEGLKPGKVMGEDGKRLQDKKSGQQFKYQVVTGELVPEDSRDSDGDGILDGGDINPTDPKVGSWIDTPNSQEPNSTLRTLFEALDKAMKDPAPDSKDPKKTDRQKLDGVLKALEAAVGSHDFLQTLVPGAQQRRADWLAYIKADPSVVKIFNQANLREGIASVIRSVKVGSPSPLESRVYDAWKECRNEANTWAPTPTYRPPNGTLAETEPMPHFVESFRQTKCVDPGWVAVKCGALPTELKQVVAMVVLWEWLEGVNAPRDVIVVGGATRELEHDKPSLGLFERELDYLSHGPLQGRDSKQDRSHNKKTGGKK
jgi:hypothetical protein